MTDPYELTAKCLDRIARLDAELGAFVAVDASGAEDMARKSAARWSAGTPLSPLDGMPVAIKANIAVHGMPFHAGIGAYRHRVAARDAACVARLRAGGAVILGLVNMDEGGLGASTDNMWFGRTRNPWRQGLTAGGSSGGAAAAVAAGMCTAALGTDTLGSVRIPAAYCGVFGHRPLAGRVAKPGVMPLARGMDEVGVLARSARDCGTILAWLTGETYAPIAPRSLCVVDMVGCVDIELDHQAALSRAARIAERDGCSVRTITLDGYDPARVRRAALLVMEREAADIHREALLQQSGGFSPHFRDMLAWGAAQPADKVEAAYTFLARTGALLRAAFASYDAVLAPTTPQGAFRFGTPAPPSQGDLTALASIAGLASTAFPMGINSDGLPCSIQAIAANDEVCLAVATKLSSLQS